MGSKSSPPPAPDPTATANAQTQSNQSNAQFNAVLNRPNINSPYGSQTWTQNGTDPNTGAPLWTQNINVSPAAQHAIDNTIAGQDALSQLSVGAAGNVANAIGHPIDPSQLGGIQTSVQGYSQMGLDHNGPQVGNGLQSGVDTSQLPGYATNVNGGDLDGARQQAQQAIYGRQTSMLDPQYNNQKEALDSQLANQGITQGSQAYEKAQDEFARQRDFAYGQARDSAITGGNDFANQQFQQGLQNAGLNNAARQGYFGEGVTNVGIGNNAAQTGFGNETTALGVNNAANQLNFNNNIAAGQFGNQANQQQLAQLLQLHNQPLNEYSAIHSGSQVQTPQFQATPAVMAQPTDVAGIINNGYNNQLNAYNASQSSSNGAMSGLFGLGSAFAGSNAGSAALTGLMGLSDIRAKKNIEPIGKTFGGENLYKYQYKGSDVPQIGVMAQEVMEHNPDAVVRHPSGLFMVDYAQVH